MFSRPMSLRALVAAAFLGMSAGTQAATAAIEPQPAGPQTAGSRSRRQGVKAHQRAALKRRNRAANRRAHR